MSSHVLAVSNRPERVGATLNPFIIVDGAVEFIDFVTEVLGGIELIHARTPLPDGRLIHAEIEMGDANLLICDSMDGWSPHPGMLQLWVDNVARTLEHAVARGARIVTPATAFYVETTIGRMVDEWGNLWWLYNPAPGQADPTQPWEGGNDTIFSTIDNEMRSRAH